MRVGFAIAKPTLRLLFQFGIDAAINKGNGKAYFYRASHFTRYDIKRDQTDLSSAPIIDKWPSLF